MEKEIKDVSNDKENLDITKTVVPRSYPWRRYLARSFDYGVFVYVVSAILVLLKYKGSEYSFWFMPTLISFIFVFIESIMLSIFGTTLGKKIFNIKLTKDGKKMDFKTALSRSFKVWGEGMGFCIPIVSLITQISSDNYLMKNGKTSWDKDLKIDVSYKKFGVLRILFIIFLVIAFLFLSSLYLDMSSRTHKTTNDSNTNNIVKTYSNDWYKIKIDEDASIMYPSKELEMQAGTYKEYSGAGMKILGVYDPSNVVLQQVGLNEFSNNAFNNFARIIISKAVNEESSGITPKDKIKITAQELEGMKKEYKDTIEAGFKTLNIKLIEFKSVTIEKVNDLYALTIIYTRQLADNPIVLVKQYIFFNNYNTYTVTMSHRVDDIDKYESIYKEIIDSFEI